MPKMFSPSTMFLKLFFAHENMKNPTSKVAKPAQIQPKSQFLFHKNPPPRDFSIITLQATYIVQKHNNSFKGNLFYLVTSIDLTIYKVFPR